MPVIKCVHLGSNWEFLATVSLLARSSSTPPSMQCCFSGLVLEVSSVLSLWIAFQLPELRSSQGEPSAFGCLHFLFPSAAVSLIPV